MLGLHFTPILHFTLSLQSAVCILHSVCILPLDRSLQSAVRNLRFTLTVKADTRYFSKKHQQIFLLDAIFFEQ